MEHYLRTGNSTALAAAVEWQYTANVGKTAVDKYRHSEKIFFVSEQLAVV
jgi:hypothetical protein